jgi:hypothetical protein
MKHLIKSIIAGSLLYATTSFAATITVYSDAATAEADFLASLRGATVTENFDGLGGAQVLGANEQNSWENTSPLFSTNVGTFELTAAGQTYNNPNNKNLNIEGLNTGEFGRKVLASNSGTTNDTSDFWLDSNDAKTVKWSLDNPLKGDFNAIGFYLADPSDVSANLTLTYSDGSSETATYTFNYPSANQGLFYVTILAAKNIVGGSILFSNSTSNDGWGIDDITIGNVPEPGTLLLLGLGLLGLGIARRRTQA